MPDISIIHPSRGRSLMAFDTAKLWATNAVNPHMIQYILSLDIDETGLLDYKNNFNQTRRLFGITSLSINNNNNVVQAANAGAKYAVGDVLVLISDDFSCPAEWDRFILENIDPEKEEALAVNDGLQPIGNNILTLPIITNKLYRKLGYVYYPEYSGIRADDDLAQTCVAMNCLKRNYDKPFFHLHWVNKKKERDATNNRHDSPEGWRIGNEVYKRRKEINFGIV